MDSDKIEYQPLEYHERYGDWAGNPQGSPPKFDQCAALIFPSHTWIPRQCSFKAKFDPGPDGEPTACGKHRKKKR